MSNPLLESSVSNLEKFAVGTLSSLVGGSFSNHATRSMMRFQDALNDQNALDAYNRQRSLMADAASLQKLGMLKAGYNTAFGSTGSVQSVSAPSSSSVGLGSVQTNNMPTSFQSLLDAKNADSNAKQSDSYSKLMDSQRFGQDIQNDYAVANILSDIDNKVADTRDKNSKARYQELENNLLAKYGDRQEDLQTGILENQKAASADEAAIASINHKIAESTRSDKEAYAHELVENEQKKGKLYDAQVVTEKGKVLVQKSEIAKNYASAEESRTHSGLNLAQLGFVNSQKTAQDIQNSINGDDRVVKASIQRLINAAKTAGPQSFGEYAWSIFNNPNATLGQKWKAGFASILGWVERSLGGESSRLPQQVYDDLKTAASSATKAARERLRSHPGKHRVAVWKR